MEAMQESVVEVPVRRSLIDIVADMRRILHEVDDAEGELSPTLEAELNACEEDMATKIDRCLWVMQEAQSVAAVFEERSNDLAARAKSAKAKADRLKTYVAGALREAKLDRLPTPNYPGVRLQRNPASVEIESEDAFVAAHKDDGLVHFEPKIDKKAVLDRLKAGQAVVGAKIAPETNHLRFK